MFDRSQKFYYYGNPQAIVSAKDLREVHRDGLKRKCDVELNYIKTKLFVRELTKVGE